MHFVRIVTIGNLIQIFYTIKMKCLCTIIPCAKKTDIFYVLSGGINVNIFVHFFLYLCKLLKDHFQFLFIFYHFCIGMGPDSVLSQVYLFDSIKMNVIVQKLCS